MSYPSPFQSSWYLQTFAENFIQKNYPVDVTFPFEKIGTTLLFLGMRKVLGNEELTDYGDAVIDSVLLLQKARELNCREIILDYVREDSLLYSSFSSQKNVSITHQEVAPFIRLPNSWETYLESIDRVDRKELKRKLRRLESVPHSFKVYSASDASIFSEFIRLHKLSDSSKEKFMSSRMEDFFHDLAMVPKKDWSICTATLKIEEKYVAAILFFENEIRVMLYNSGYDPAYKYYSNGLILHALLIRRNIEKGLKIHDFMRGKERYKYDLGGRDLNLYKISITL